MTLSFSSTYLHIYIQITNTHQPSYHHTLTHAHNHPWHTFPSHSHREMGSKSDPPLIPLELPLLSEATPTEPQVTPSLQNATPTQPQTTPSSQQRN